VEDSKYPQVSALLERRVIKRKRTALWENDHMQEALRLYFFAFKIRQAAFERDGGSLREPEILRDFRAAP
jgi:hypothetical protein